MDVATGLALPPLALLLLQTLNEVTKVVQKFRRAQQSVMDKTVIFEDHILKLQLELEEFTELSPNLPEDLSKHFRVLFHTFLAKLKAIEAELGVLLGRDLSLGVSVIISSIDRATQDVDYWHGKITSFFEQLARFPKPFADPRVPDPRTALGRVRLVNQAIFSATETTPSELTLTADQVPVPLALLPDSSVFMPQLGQPLLVEIKKYEPTTPGNQIVRMKHDVMDLARILSAADIASRGILNCSGYRHDSEKDLFELVFRIPEHLSKPRSLRQVLTDKDFKDQVLHPLDERLSLAKQLARAVLHVHSKNHVHKNIRPETILLFEVSSPAAERTHHRSGNPKAYPISLGEAFLTGFERVRKDDADTAPMQEMTWAEDIYRHPSRQGVNHLEGKFTMLHDVYSLGVCLLEISMWRSFAIMETRNGQSIKVNNKKACNLMEAGLPSGIARLKNPQDIQKKFIRDAQNRIPIAFGPRFSQVVVRCLQCVETFDADAEKDPALLGIKYVYLDGAVRTRGDSDMRDYPEWFEPEDLAIFMSLRYSPAGSSLKSWEGKEKS